MNLREEIQKSFSGKNYSAIFILAEFPEIEDNLVSFFKQYALELVGEDEGSLCVDRKEIIKRIEETENNG